MGRPKKEGGRPPQKASKRVAKKGSLQAKVNMSHKGSKLHTWSEEDMKWCIEEHAKDMATKPQKEWRSMRFFHRATGIPLSTLHYRFSGKVDGFTHQSGGKNRSSALEEEAEEALVKRAGVYKWVVQNNGPEGS